MKVAITGSTGLAGNIKTVIEATPYLGDKHKVDSFRTSSHIDFKQYDVFINCANIGFDQVQLLEDCFKFFKDHKKKTIVNISSRAHQPNISKGYMYAAQKAALTHYANNLVYNNAQKRCRIMTVHLGLLNEYHSFDSSPTAIQWSFEVESSLPQIFKPGAGSLFGHKSTDLHNFMPLLRQSRFI